MSEPVRTDTERLDEKTPPRAWLILVVTYLASICAPIVQFKIPPLANWLFANFASVGLDGATFGMLMSAMAIIGCILAFPAAFIAQKLGLKTTMLVSLATLAVGSFISIFASTIPALLCSRLIEGIGIGLVGVVGPTCVSIWFPPRRRGLALGIWATWVPFGTVLMFGIAPTMAGGSVAADPTGYKTVFAFCTIFCIIALILFAAIFKLPEGKEEEAVVVQGSLREALPLLKNKYIWYLGIVFLCLCCCTLAIVTTYYQQFLTAAAPNGLGWSESLAGSVMTIPMIISVFCAPLAGGISDRLEPNSKRWIAVCSGVALLVSVFFGFVTGEYAMVALVIFIALQGVAGAFVAGGCRPMAPMIMGGTATGAVMGMAVLQFMQNLGQAVGSPVFGALVDAFGGNFGIPSMIIQIPLLVIGIIFGVLIKPFKYDTIPEEHRDEGHIADGQ
ncbi:MAG: MFS transporter [Coriobacteriales bacterium]|jgi:MFS family permease